LQSLEKIVIDPIRCPNALKEFVNYELDKNKDGTFRDEYPDKNNHFIDLTRYALEKEMQARDSRKVLENPNNFIIGL
jgi:phage terminase large subunit